MSDPTRESQQDSSLGEPCPSARPPSAPLPLELGEEQIERYSRQLLLPGVGGRGQTRLLRASVFVVGAGGLGSPLLQYLAASGIGRIAVADADRVDLSNLGRQVLYGVPDIGRLKVQAAADALARLNPGVQVVPLPVRVEAENLAELTAGYDVLVDGSDSFAAKFAVNDEARRSRRPAIIGSVLGFEGQCIAVVPGGGACFRCLFEEEPPAGSALTCQQAGVLGALVGVVGSLQAAEVLKLVLGLGASEGLLQLDLRSGSVRRVRFERRPDCPACAQVESVGGAD